MAAPPASGPLRPLPRLIRRQWTPHIPPSILDLLRPKLLLEAPVPGLKLSTDIRPVSDLKSHGAEIVRQVNDTSRPVVLTRHGRSVAVVLSIEEYEANVELRAWDDLRRAIRQGERELEEQGPVPNAVVMDYLRTVANKA